MNDPIPEHDCVAVLGMGASGVGAIRLLHALGKRVIATDDRDSLAREIPPEVDLRLGGLDIGDASAVVLSPSLNPEWPENRDKAGLRAIWQRWQSDAIDLWSEIELAIAAFDGAVLTVGGTDGKSTTAALATALLRTSGHVTLLGGNSWSALSSVVVDQGAAATHAVVEVSAFQLWEPHRVRPSVSILTNIAPDHLDHYAEESDYVTAKLHIHRNLDAGSAAVLHAADPLLRAAAQGLRGRGVSTFGFGLDEPLTCEGWSGRGWIDADALRVDDEHGSLVVPLTALRLPGHHNRKNALAALVGVRRLLGTDSGTFGVATASAGFSGFSGLPHRVEFIREFGGVSYYDDSKATNVHAAVAGIRSMERPLVAIIGGVDKGLDLEPLVDALADKARSVIVIGDLRERFCAESRDRPFTVVEATDMSEAVAHALEMSRAGDAVLLSPGCSSFDMFRSFEHRGDVFAALVRAS